MAEREPIIATKPLKAEKPKSKVIGVITSPKTTVALLGTLAVLAAPAGAVARGAAAVGRAVVPKTVGGALRAGIALPTAVGVLSTSKKARETVKTILDPRESVKRGEKIGQIIENPDILKSDIDKKGFRQTITDTAKAAGVIGAGAAVAAGGIVAAKKATDIVKSKIPSRETIPTPSIVGGTSARAIVPSTAAVLPAQPVNLAQIPGEVKPEKEEKLVPAPTTKPEKPIKISQKVQVLVNSKINKGKKTYCCR